MMIHEKRRNKSPLRLQRTKKLNEFEFHENESSQIALHKSEPIKNDLDN